MPTTPRSYRFIDTEDELLDFARTEFDAADGAPIALDIEEDREHGYNPVVALVQVTIGTSDFVIDPLTIAPEVLEPVIEFLCLTPSAVVMHGCRNDVTGLKRDFGVGPENVRDTQTAARFLGNGAFGLAALLEARFGVQLDKAVRRSNWLRRPLTRDQLDYAREDTRYLLPLWQGLVDEVDAAGWGDALDEECRAMRDLPADRAPFDPLGWRRIKGAKQLSDREQLRAAAIWAWRDRTASALGRHPSRMLAPWAVLVLARSGGSGVAAGSRGIPSDLPSQHLESLVAALDSPPTVSLRPPREPRERHTVDADTFEERMSRLGRWRAEVSDATRLEPGFLAPRTVLEMVARADVESPEDYAELPEVRAWRANRWGDAWIRMR